MTWTTIIDEQTQANEDQPLTPPSPLTPQQIRNRIKGHRKVRAGDLVPHEWNFRLHPHGQKAALAAIYQEVGFARSLLAYELPDGRLKLIDGHLRRDLDPDLEVDVEVLDVNEEEARTLLLCIDPLAALAKTQEQIHQRLLELTPIEVPDLRAALEAAARGDFEHKPFPKIAPETIQPQFYILIPCRDEKQQVELLQRFLDEGLKCEAKIA